MKKKIKKETLRLMRWAEDGYPPIDLSKELNGILELIKEIKRLRNEKETSKTKRGRYGSC